MIQMARHLLDQRSPTQRRTTPKNVSTYLASSASESKSSTLGVQPSVGIGTKENCSIHVGCIRSCQNITELWLQPNRSFLQRGIYHVYMQRPGSEIGSADNILSIVRPKLVYTGLIEQLQQFFKVRKPSSVASAKSEGEARRHWGWWRSRSC
ncbi:E3 ubiquitin ligase UBR4, C-terminal [Dillenia turbinata]|uniref:E3 ubiquitin ligase UBR4, C-terminal n=1 Tax=Dillenia turbinata TaxID=194707 RepID=A0AAN8VDP6_9MAGN